MRAVIFGLDQALWNSEKQLHDDIGELLNILGRLGMVLGGLTSGDHRHIAHLEEVGVRQQFTAVVSAEHVTHALPHPAGIRLLLGELNAAQSEATFVSADPEAIRAAKEAGVDKIVAVALDSGQHQALQQAGATHIIAQTAGLLDVLE